MSFLDQYPNELEQFIEYTCEYILYHIKCINFTNNMILKYFFYLSSVYCYSYECFTTNGHSHRISDA